MSALPVKAFLLVPLFVVAVIGCAVQGDMPPIVPDEVLSPSYANGREPVFESPSKESEIPVKKLNTQKASKEELGSLSDEIELVWKVPERKVDYFVISYGFSRDSLNNTIKKKPEELLRVSDRIKGEAYKFIIPNIPLEKTVYVTVSAVIEGEEPLKAEVVELKPE